MKDENVKVLTETQSVAVGLEEPVVLKFWQQGIVSMIKIFFAGLCCMAIYMLITMGALYVVPSISVYVYQLSGLQAVELSSNASVDFVTSLSVWLLPSLFLDAALFVLFILCVKYIVKYLMFLRDKAVNDFIEKVTGLKKATSEKVKNKFTFFPKKCKSE